MRIVRLGFRNIEEILGCCFLVVMVISVAIGVIARMMDAAAVWTNEVSRYAFLWSVYLGSVVAVKRKSHIALDLLAQFFPKKLNKWIKAISNVFLLVLFFMIFFYGAELVKNTWNISSSSLQIPVGLIYSVIPLSFLLMFIYTLVQLYQDFFKVRAYGWNSTDVGKEWGVE